MTFAYLAGVPFSTEPDQISWDYQMKVKEHQTVGGKVIQILGVTLGDMTVSGMFGTGTDGSGETWPNQLKFRNEIISYVRRVERSGFPASLRFVYTPRKFDFKVFVKAMTPLSFSKEEIAPRWQLTLMIDQDATAEVEKGIKDLYLKRLLNGVGWKQTDYNGASASDLTTLLGGKTEGEYFQQLAQDAFNAGLQSGQITGGLGTGSNGQPGTGSGTDGSGG